MLQLSVAEERKRGRRAQVSQTERIKHREAGLIAHTLPARPGAAAKVRAQGRQRTGKPVMQLFSGLRLLSVATSGALELLILSMWL